MASIDPAPHRSGVPPSQEGLVVPKQLSDVLGEFARTVVTDFSVETSLRRLAVGAVAILPVRGAGVTLSGPGGVQQLVGSSGDLREGAPDLSIAVCEADEVVGSLDLYGERRGALDGPAIQTAQTLADVGSAYLTVARGRTDAQDSSERARRSSAHDDASVRALQLSEQRKAAVLASVLDGVVTIDEDGCILEFNPAAERIFGRAEHDATGRDLAELLSPPEPLGARWVGIDRYLASDEGPVVGRRTRVTGTRADGETFPAEVSITAVDGPGPDLFTAFVRDLAHWAAADAERRDLEGRVQQAERLASLGLLAGGVAHDFNNLLTVIVNYATFIAERGTDEDTRANAAEIVASAERGARLTQQLLLFARREPVHRAPLDLGEVVRGVRELLVQAVGEGIDLDVVEAHDLPLVVGDRGQLEQVLVNLAVNARDAMPDGGTLTIETSLVRSDDVAGGACVQLRVTDVGEGMAEHVAARAFDPFFSTKTAGHGSGLGLATVYGVVFDSGGTVDLRSAPGEGTTFLVRLPVPSTNVGSSPRRREAVPSSVATSVVGRGETVLVVEDQVPVRRMVVAMLVRNGYDVVEADDAPGGLELASGRAFDLILTDVVMPGLSGRDLVAGVRGHRPSQRVLYMSGYSGGAFGEERALAPGEALIHKPFREPELLAAVRTALGSDSEIPGDQCGAEVR